MPKLWDKGYKINKQIEDFTIGNDYLIDQKLVKYDCIASKAHAKMLAQIGILNASELNKVTNELNNIIKLINQDRFHIKKEDEDCHTAIENYLTKKLGLAGRKIHTARSRNDQILTALRLFYKDELSEIKQSIKSTQTAIRRFQKKYGEIKIPGYTHSRKAMPSSISMWAQSFIDSLEDNLKLIEISYELLDQNPLGTGAGYGIPIGIDRNLTTKILHFSKIQENSIYTQHSRGKFESTILHSMTQIMFDINKISSDLILFSMPEFGFFELPINFCTGSSIMPHKKNPDVLELLRAKYHVVVSCEFQIKNLIGNILSGYNRDLQLTKEPTFKGLETTKECLSITILLFDNLKVNEENCKKALTKELYATEELYKLVKGGTPFRDAYKMISKKY